MLYHYSAATKAGKVIEGEVDVNTLPEVLQYLASKDLRPLLVKPQKKSGRLLGGFFQKVTISDKVFLTRYLALMLKAGTDLLSAINILIDDFEKPAIREFLLEVRANLSKGQPFYVVFERYPKIFSAVFVNLIKAAEASGNLQQTFEDLSNNLQKESALRQRVKSALVYPIILLVVGVGIFIFLSFFALPKISRVFEGSGIEPPLFSRVVFAIGNFVGNNAVLIFVILIILAAGAFYFFAKNLIGRRLFNQAIQRLPLVRNIYRDLAIQRFASTYAALLRAGLPIVQATRITASVVALGGFQEALLRIANDGLEKGLTIGEAFRREPIFPKMVSSLVAISERAGHLEEVLETLADFYAMNVDNNVKTLVSFLEPALLLGMGVLIGGIALAIIVPIYQLTSQF